MFLVALVPQTDSLFSVTILYFNVITVATNAHAFCLLFCRRNFQLLSAILQPSFDLFAK